MSLPFSTKFANKFVLSIILFESILFIFGIYCKIFDYFLITLILMGISIHPLFRISNRFTDHILLPINKQHLLDLLMEGCDKDRKGIESYYHFSYDFRNRYLTPNPNQCEKMRRYKDDIALVLDDKTFVTDCTSKSNLQPDEFQIKCQLYEPKDAIQDAVLEGLNVQKETQSFIQQGLETQKDAQSIIREILSSQEETQSFVRQELEIQKDVQSVAREILSSQEETQSFVRQELEIQKDVQSVTNEILDNLDKLKDKQVIACDGLKVQNNGLSVIHELPDNARVTVSDVPEEAPDIPRDMRDLPEVFKTPRAQKKLNEMIEARHLDESFNWPKVAYPTKNVKFKESTFLIAVFAHALADYLGLSHRYRWPYFYKLWGKMNYSSLFNAAMNHKSYNDLYLTPVREIFPDFQKNRDF